jgi:acid phosphatase
VFEGVYTHPALQVPWYALLGNHDYRGNPQAQIDYAARSKRWRMPARYYQVADAALVRADTDLFAIDTSPFVERYRAKDGTIGSNTRSQDTARQLAWLDQTLSQSRAKWKLVTGHHPIRSGGSGHGDQPEIIAQVLPILNRHGVQAYIAGHDHDLQHIRRDGIERRRDGGASGGAGGGHTLLPRHRRLRHGADRRRPVVVRPVRRTRRQPVQRLGAGARYGMTGGI